jgi:hypothetical protein
MELKTVTLEQMEEAAVAVEHALVLVVLVVQVLS